MFERELKQEKNLESRERDLRRQRANEVIAFLSSPFKLYTVVLVFISVKVEARFLEAQEKKDAKDDKMEALLRKVDADFLAMIKEAEDDESKGQENIPMV